MLANPKRANDRRLGRHTPDEAERYFVERNDVDVNTARGIGHDDQIGFRDERLRAKNALGFAQTKVDASIANLNRNEATYDARSGGCMEIRRQTRDSRRELGSTGFERRIRVYVDPANDLAMAYRGWRGTRTRRVSKTLPLPAGS